MRQVQHDLLWVGAMALLLFGGCGDDDGGSSTPRADAGQDAVEDTASDAGEDAAHDGSDTGEDADVAPDVPDCTTTAEDCEPNQELDTEACACVELFADCEDGEVVAFDDGSTWPSFGADHGGSRSQPVDQGISPTNAAALTAAWAWAGPEVTSTPALVDGIVYFGDWAGMLRARGAATGCIVWEVPLTDGALTASPLVQGGVLYIADSGGFLHAVSIGNGSTLWSVQLDDHPSTHIFSSPEILGETLIIGVAGTELTEALDEYTFRGSVVGLDPSTGDEKWRVYTTTDDEEGGAGVSVWSSAAIDEELGLAYIGTGNTYEEPASPLADGLIAIDIAAGTLSWSRQFTEGDVYRVFGTPPLGPDADVGAAPNLFMAGDTAVVGVGDKAGVYSVLDRQTGETIWAVQLTQGSHLGGVMTAAAVADGQVFVSSNLWPDGFDTENPFFPDFQNDNNTSHVFGLDAETGEINWEITLPRPSLGALSTTGGVVFVGTTDGTLYALSATDGATLWSDRTGFTMAAGQSLAGGTLFVPHGFDFFGLEPGPENARGGLTAYRVP